jgi:hypothetical protein
VRAPAALRIARTSVEPGADNPSSSSAAPLAGARDDELRGSTWSPPAAHGLVDRLRDQAAGGGGALGAGRCDALASEGVARRPGSGEARGDRLLEARDLATVPALLLGVATTIPRRGSGSMRGLLVAGAAVPPLLLSTNRIIVAHCLGNAAGRLAGHRPLHRPEHPEERLPCQRGSDAAHGRHLCARQHRC